MGPCGQRLKPAEMKKEALFQEKDHDMPERIIVLALSVIFFVLSVLLYGKASRPMKAITVVKSDMAAKLSLSEIEADLREASKVPVNTATAEELTALPGIGPVMASRIAEHREKNGRFYSVESLLDVKGIGPAKLEKIKEHIRLK